MNKQPWTIRSIFATVMLLLTTLSLLTAIALVILTTRLQAATENIGDAVESVRIVEEAEIDLLLHATRRQTLVGHDIEGNLREKMLAAREYVSSPREMRLLETAVASVDSYLVSSRDPDVQPAVLEGRHAAAYGALESLATLNVIQARESREDAARGNRAGTVLGIGVAALLLVVVGVAGNWLRRVFRPLFGLAETMARFGQGEREARVEETGPPEVREMSRRFNELAEAVEAQRRSQLAFLGGVAHDLRNPLAAMSMSLELLAAKVAPEHRSIVDRGERQLTRIQRMVDDFLNLARMDAGELDLDLHAHDLRSIVRDAPSDPRVSLRLPEEPVMVRCDALRIEQVVTNLISNALKYSRRDAPVEVELAEKSGRAVLRVVDHGVGMSEDEQRELFQPFSRVGASRKMAPGVGLGLWVAARIADAHDGALSVESVPGQGSTFSLQLRLLDLDLTQVSAGERRVSALHSA